MYLFVQWSPKRVRALMPLVDEARYECTTSLITFQIVGIFMLYLLTVNTNIYYFGQATNTCDDIIHIHN